MERTTTNKKHTTLDLSYSGCCATNPREAGDYLSFMGRMATNKVKTTLGLSFWGCCATNPRETGDYLSFMGRTATNKTHTTKDLSFGELNAIKTPELLSGMARELL